MTPTLFLLLRVLITALGVAAGSAVLWRRARSRRAVGPLTVLWAGVWTVAGSALATILLGPLGISAFGMIHMVYLACVVGIPAVGVIVVAARARRRMETTPAAWLVVAAGLLCAPLGVYASFVEPRDLRLETAVVALPPERGGASPVRVGILADLQCDDVGAFETRVVETLLAEQPDLILVPGDLFQPQLDRLAEWQRVREPLMALLARVRAPHGVYFVPGDVDAGDTLRALREATDWVILEDEVVQVRVRDRDLTIAGMRSRASHDVAAALERREGTDDVRILMCHAPDIVLSLRGAPRADLIVAGHTHGGQVVVPFFGPPITLSRVPRHVAAGGLHDVGGRALYVSRGAGLERNQAPPLRLLCPPEVSVLTLESRPAQRP